MNDSPINLIDLSLTAPAPPDIWVRRPNLVESLVHVVRSSRDSVCLEAPAGNGKTTLLLELAHTSDKPCFCVFISTPSRLAYDPIFIRHDLVNQIHWYLKGVRYPDAEEPTSGDLRNYWIKCAQSLQKRRCSAFVIVDGLDELPEEDSHIKNAIIDLLPLGIRGFRVIFSGDKELIFRHRRWELPTKSFPVPQFSQHESDDFLQDIVQDSGTSRLLKKSSFRPASGDD